MAQYLSKKTLLSVYRVLSNLDPEHKQGATQLISSIRYFVALDRFYSENGRNCNVGNKKDKDLYCKYIEEVVGVCAGLYANQFYYPLKQHNGDCCTGSNFFSTNVVQNSFENTNKQYTYPKGRFPPLFDIQNGELIRNIAYYNNFLTLLRNNNSQRVALVFWLLRNQPLQVESSLYDAIVSKFKQLYSNELTSCLIPDQLVFTKVCNDYDFESLSNTKEELTDNDIKVLFSNDNAKALAKMKAICPIIIYGPPGTGKTYKLQHEYCSNFDEENQFVVTFHQSFSYEDFLEGLKPVEDKESNDNISYKVERGIFYRACERACILAGFKGLEDTLEAPFDTRNARFSKAVKTGNFVLICIDEINRGNVSSIFGELISLIEDKKRLGTEDEMTTVLPYSKKKFGVPANLFIVGTMNTADRSIQLLDSAIRRRFRFEELLPNYDVITNGDAKAILQGINSRIRCLLNKDSQIGHSYLMHSKNNKDILDALTNKIIPLLEEYFYNDISQVRFVLNEMKDDKYNFYKEDEDAKDAFTAYQNFADIDAEDKSFFSLDESIRDIEDENECVKYIKHLLPTEE